ncbi:hypothetical protein [Massilia horti]|uniref:Uncharacterized protein n=1 Tax=Massilia horti TaxID=2562153 RepID=A0A4Y9SXC5_9BURK|nr:hypothetical protein [Massilia horti]TFW31501.1 hypothetical protein E4O92_13655 [Massilia horti]
MKKILFAIVFIAVLAFLLAVSSGRFVPDAIEGNQAKNLVKAIAPLAAAEDQSVYWGAGFTAFHIEVFGVLDPQVQDRILRQLKAEIARMGLQKRVKVQFYRHMELREVARQGSWTKREVIKSDLLREVILP